MQMFGQRWEKYAKPYQDSKLNMAVSEETDFSVDAMFFFLQSFETPVYSIKMKIY